MRCVTERCVFQLTLGGLELIEIAPWVDLEKDILAHIGFEPIIKGEPRLMDARIFADGLMGLTADLLTVPLEARFVSMAALDEVESLGTEIEKRLAAIGKRVQMVVNHDNFYLAPVPAARRVIRHRRCSRAILPRRQEFPEACSQAAPATCWP